MEYFRPIAMTDPARPAGALTLAGTNSYSGGTTFAGGAVVIAAISLWCVYNDRKEKAERKASEAVKA